MPNLSIRERPGPATSDSRQTSKAGHMLSCRLSKIRVSVGKALKARHVPKLEFRLNQLSAAQEAVELELNRLEEKGIDG